MPSSQANNLNCNRLVVLTHPSRSEALDSVSNRKMHLQVISWFPRHHRMLSNLLHKIARATGGNVPACNLVDCEPSVVLVTTEPSHSDVSAIRCPVLDDQALSKSSVTASACNEMQCSNQSSSAQLQN